MLTAPSFEATSVEAVGGGTDVDVTGTVTDDQNPAGLTVILEGIVSGTATVDANGNFSFRGSASGPGFVTLSVTDNDSETGEGQVEFFDNAPMFTSFSVTQLNGNAWRVEGVVSDEFQAGLTVTFGGVLPSGLSTTVKSDGSFSLDFTWASPPMGMATGDVDDWWSQSAVTAEEFVWV